MTYNVVIEVGPGTAAAIRAEAARDRAETGATTATTQAGIATAAAASASSAATATAADRVQTGLDRTAAEAAAVSTAADALATAADRVQTGLDRDAAASSEAQALTAKSQAELAAIAAGAPIVATLTTPTPADGTVELIAFAPGFLVHQVVSGSWSDPAYLGPLTFADRTAPIAALIALLPDGTVAEMAGLKYIVDSTATGAASAAYDLGEDGLRVFDDAHPSQLGAVGDGVTDDTAALQSAVAASKRVLLSQSHVLDGRLDLNDWQCIEGDGESQLLMQPGNTNIAMLGLAKEGIQLKGFRIDGANGGQLDAGLIQLNGCTDFLVEDVVLENGGTIGAASPRGVNGISFATDGYPGGSKSSGRINRLTTRNFTKAPFNWTTFAENGILTNSAFYDSVGNGQTPAIQVNGGRKLTVINCLVDGTEGPAVAIASVGTVPAYAAQDVTLMGNTYRRVGTLGEANSEKSVYLISDGQGAGDLKRINISNEVIEGCASGILKTGGGVQEISLHNIRSRGTVGAYDLQNVHDIRLSRLTLDDFNPSNIAALAAFTLRTATLVRLDGAEINAAGLDTTGQIISCTVASSDVRMRGIRYRGNLTLIGTSDTDYLTDAIIEATTEKASAAGATTTIQLLKVPDGRTIQIEVELSTANGAVYATQRLKVTADAAAGTATIRENAYLFNSKGGITTGLFADITASNVLRLRFLNSSAADLTLHLKIKLIM